MCTVKEKRKVLERSILPDPFFFRFLLLYFIDVPISYIFVILYYKYPLERDTHISLLIEMGFSALAIADRVGHESIDITYRYAHLFPNKQTEMADKLDMERMESLNQTENCTVIQFHMDKEFEPERRKGI